LIVAGHQPNYLPWLGFFDKMRRCDVFIIEDNIQFETRGFINRNKVKVHTSTANNVMWLTVPIKHAGRRQLINEVQISNLDSDWAKRHWLTLKYNYSKAPFWNKYCGFFEQTFNRNWSSLLDLNMNLIQGLMNFLNIKTPLVMASSLNVSKKKSELVLAQCIALGGTVQLSGDGAREYLDVKSFEEAGIEVVFQDFHYPKYEQVFGEFIPNLSVVDYLFCTGNESVETNTLSDKSD
jgi:hypothetical protein